MDSRIEISQSTRAPRTVSKFVTTGDYNLCEVTRGDDIS